VESVTFKNYIKLSSSGRSGGGNKHECARNGIAEVQGTRELADVEKRHRSIRSNQCLVCECRRLPEQQEDIPVSVRSCGRGGLPKFRDSRGRVDEASSSVDEIPAQEVANLRACGSLRRGGVWIDRSYNEGTSSHVSDRVEYRGPGGVFPRNLDARMERNGWAGRLGKRDLE
jgi:hypothetical protein